MKTIEHMKSTFIRNYCIIAVFVFPAILSAKGSNPPIELWYDQPADEWMKSTPVGNGRLGAMVYGGVLGEIIAINESSMVRSSRSAPRTTFRERKDEGVTAIILRRKTG